MPALPLDITLSQSVRLERLTRPIAIGNIQQKPQTMRFVHGLRYIPRPQTTLHGGLRFAFIRGCWFFPSRSAAACDTQLSGRQAARENGGVRS
ncbi:MAG: hypothetical protein L0387_21985 [Acidobacteria bacterium]|nr:hypothetical protein [Acidobacteriota bacterium]MCI0723074.1 hypothetical protein [Acidobacteriota bacterium]